MIRGEGSLVGLSPTCCSGLEVSRVGYRRALVALCPRYCRLEKWMGEMGGESPRRRYEVPCPSRFGKLPILDDVFN